MEIPQTQCTQCGVSWGHGLCNKVFVILEHSLESLKGFMLSKCSGLLRKQVSGILEEETISSTQATLKPHENEDDEFPAQGFGRGPRFLPLEHAGPWNRKASSSASLLICFSTPWGLLASLKLAGCGETHRMYERSIHTATVLRRVLKVIPRGEGGVIIGYCLREQLSLLPFQGWGQERGEGPCRSWSM